MHAWHSWRIPLTQAIVQSPLYSICTFALSCSGFLRDTELLHRCNIIWPMNQTQFLDGRSADWQARVFVLTLPQSTALQQIQQSDEPARLHRMPWTKVVIEFTGFKYETRTSMAMCFRHAYHRPSTKRSANVKRIPASFKRTSKGPGLIVPRRTVATRGTLPSRGAA